MSNRRHDAEFDGTTDRRDFPVLDAAVEHQWKFLLFAGAGKLILEHASALYEGDAARFSHEARKAWVDFKSLEPLDERATELLRLVVIARLEAAVL